MMPDNVEEEIRRLCDLWDTLSQAERIVLAEHVRMLRGELDE